MRRPTWLRKYIVPLVLGLLMAVLQAAYAETLVFQRKEIRIPDIPGYLTLKCDFHMHTVFSDGVVWPTVRVREAWSEGLDAISITDHIEYLEHTKDIKTDFNRPYEIALPEAEALSLVLIKGTEVTRSQPTGHYNAIFLEDVNPLDQPDSLKALKAAVDQGAFVFWNHPGWKDTDENGLARWQPVHTTIYEKGLIQGIEVVNTRDYYPNAHRWAIEKKLTMLGNTDIHQPRAHIYRPGEIRPLTLVFARGKNRSSIKEALFDRRTAVYSEGNLYGEQRFLEPLFEESVELLTPGITLKGKKGWDYNQGWAYLQVKNKSDIAFKLTADGKVDGIDFPQQVTLMPNAIVLLKVSVSGNNLKPGTSAVELPYRVENLHLSPEQSLPVTLELEIDRIPDSGM
jgi:3',5'-nucleoside bisphosphate phosphatase